MVLAMFVLMIEPSYQANSVLLGNISVFET